MYADNQYDYGHLLDVEEFETDHLHDDMYTIFSNPLVS